MFIGREKELKELNSLYDSDQFEFVVLYGRRRVGKTALISRFLEQKNAIYFMGIESNAKQNLENLTQSIFQTGSDSFPLSFLNFQAALEYVFKRAEKERLILHLASMLERVKENIHINSSLCLDIKQKYPYAFECAAAILPIIQKHFGVQISESEVSYIAVYLAVILDQIKGPANVAIVCASGVGTSMLLSCRLMKEFGERIHIVGTFPSYQADQILLECPETKLILSTIPFHHDMGVPVLEISPLLKMEDIRRIHQVLDHGTTKNMHRSVLQESLFHVFEKGNEEEILHKMADMLQSKGCIEDTEAFLSSVKEREALYSTLYGKIWMPHPLHSFALKDGVACGLVKNNEKIRLVFMLCLRKEDTSLYNHFFDKIVTILEDEKAFDALFNVDGFEQFEKMFESLI